MCKYLVRPLNEILDEFQIAGFRDADNYKNIAIYNKKHRILFDSWGREDIIKNVKVDKMLSDEEIYKIMDDRMYTEVEYHKEKRLILSYFTPTGKLIINSLGEFKSRFDSVPLLTGVLVYGGNGWKL